MSTIVKCPECNVDVPEACQDEPTYNESLCEDCEAVGEDEESEWEAHVSIAGYRTCRQCEERKKCSARSYVCDDCIGDYCEGRADALESAYERAEHDMSYRYSRWGNYG